MKNVLFFNEKCAIIIMGQEEHKMSCFIHEKQKVLVT